MTADGVAASVMVGIGETYLPAFVLAISSSQLACGLVSTVPMLIGAVLQLCAPWAVRQLGSYRRWVVLAAVVQAVGFLPLLVAAIVGVMSVTTIFLVVADLLGNGDGRRNGLERLGRNARARAHPRPYFAWRTRFTQSGIMIGLAAGRNHSGVGQGMGLAARRPSPCCFWRRPSAASLRPISFLGNASRRRPTGRGCPRPAK